MSKMRYVGFALVINLIACAKEDTPVDVINNSSPNILLILADDLGKDAINGYQEGTIKPITPNIDAISENGLRFQNFWVNPTCTPTRGSIITGKYGFRTGVKGVGDELNSSETILQKYIHDQTNGAYSTAVIGKWHLSGNNSSFNPESFGMDYYCGLVRGAVDDYYHWQLTEDGLTTLQTNYITEKFTDLAMEWVTNQNQPWFLWLAYTAPHTPFHLPPEEMHSQGNLPEYTNGLDPLPYYMAAIEAMDYQIGRLLESLTVEERENTILIFIGDNGTPNQVAQSPFNSNMVKNTLYQGGINVPMFISGKGVLRTGEDSSLLTGTDLFSTIAQITGVSEATYQDSKSFTSLFSHPDEIRQFQYAELRDGLEESWTISNGSYKLLIKSDGSEEMYNLSDDPYEQNDLLEDNLNPTEQNIKVLLEEELSNIRQ